MRKFIGVILLVTLVLSIPVEAATVSTNTVSSATVTYTPSEKAIMRAGLCYTYGFYIEGYRYESPDEILQDFDIAPTKENVKFLNKYLKKIMY